MDNQFPVNIISQDGARQVCKKYPVAHMALKGKRPLSYLVRKILNSTIQRHSTLGHSPEDIRHGMHTTSHSPMTNPLQGFIEATPYHHPDENHRPIPEILSYCDDPPPLLQSILGSISEVL